MKKQPIRRLSERLEIPEPIVSQTAVIEIYGRRRIAIDHHEAILEYGSEKITVQTREGTVSVCGGELCITLLTRSRIEIAGTICSVELG